MGLDLLDICFRLEKHFQIRVYDSEWHKLLSKGEVYDAMPGEILSFMLERKRLCRGCGYDLRGHGDEGICPECGNSFLIEDDEASWHAVQKAISDALKVDPSIVTKDRLILRDLSGG